MIEWIIASIFSISVGYYLEWTTFQMLTFIVLFAIFLKINKKY